MFACQVRLAGLRVLAKHRVKEGIPLCIDVMEIDKWGKAQRIPACLKAPEACGSAAKPELPRLRQLEKDLMAHREARNLKPIIDSTGALIRKIEADNETVELRSIR